MSILIVMGEDIEARLAVHLLSALDADVSRMSSIAEAIRSVKERVWSAVVLDTDLPDGGGVDLIGALTNLSYDGGIVVLSAASAVSLKVRALEAGADDYIVRPYDPAEFVARMRVALRRSRRRLARAESGIVRAGPVSLDINRLEIAVPGHRPQRLTPNEMRLLHYLMAHAQRVVQHDELAAHLFGPASHATAANAVGVYVRRVRRKIERDPAHPRYIVTVRGNGYRFDTAG